MLDIQFIRDNAEEVAEKSEAKGILVDIDELLRVDSKRRKLNAETDRLRAEKNENSKKVVFTNNGERDAYRVENDQAIKLKKQIKNAEEELSKLDKQYKELLDKVPNIFPDITPRGGEEANVLVREHGTAEKKNVTDHVTWAEAKQYLDFERGAKVAGNKFYYTKGALVELEFACIQLALNFAIQAGFTPMTVPHMVKEKIANGTGFSPRGDEDQIYTTKVKGEELSLIATAEIPITGYHAGEILKADELPLLYAGISPAYRKEAGAYGKHSKGLYRVHQFNKVELYVFCEPSDSADWHEKLVAIEERLCQALEIPYRIVRIAAGDLGAPAYEKFDIEYWSPVEAEYRELMSASNVTDYQARRLHIRYTNHDGKKSPVHTLNATAMAFSRTCIALIENHQTEDGNVNIPKALQPFMGGKTEI